MKLMLTKKEYKYFRKIAETLGEEVNENDVVKISKEENGYVIDIDEAYVNIVYEEVADNLPVFVSIIKSLYYAYEAFTKNLMNRLSTYFEKK